MKKLLFLLLLVSFTSMFSQENKVVYLRAQTASMGVRADEFTAVSEWIVDGREVSILIELHQTKVTIHSPKVQNYYVVKQVEAQETVKKWLCKDPDGQSCYVAMHYLENYPDLLTIAVEYNDLVWFYICTRE